MANQAGTPQVSGSPNKRRHTARLRLDIEQSSHTLQPAEARQPGQEQRRHTQGESGTAHVDRLKRRQSSPAKPPSGTDSRRLTHRALSLGGGDSSSDSRVLQTAEWLEDLRHHYGRPRVTTELENQPPRAAAAPGAEASPGLRRPPDAAVLAAALAARLQASSSEQLLPSNRGTGADTPDAKTVRSPCGTGGSAVSPSRSHKTPPALSDIPLTPPRPGVPRPDRSVRRRSASVATPATGTSDSTGRRHSMSGRDLSLVEKAVVVGVGTLLYPFVRTPASAASSAAATHAGSTVQSTQPDAQLGVQHAVEAHQMHSPVSNLDTRLTDASSPTKPPDVFAATATFTPPQSPSRQAPSDMADTADLVLTAVPGAEAMAADSQAHSPVRTPPKLRQLPPSPVSQLGVHNKQELVTITPPPQPAGAALPAPAAVGSTAAGELVSPASSAPGGLRTLRQTYGSIPAAAGAEWEAFDASVAAAVAQLADPCSQPDGGGMPLAAAAGSVDLPHVPASSARDVRGGGPSVQFSQKETGSAALGAQADGSQPVSPLPQEIPRAPGSPSKHDAAPAASVDRAPPAAAAATPYPAMAKRHRLGVPAGMLALVVLLLSIAGIGLLACYDPVQGHGTVAMAAHRSHQAAVAGTAAWQRLQSAAAHAADTARHAPAYAEQIAAEAWQGARAAAAATQQGIATVPSLMQRMADEAATVAAADARRVAAAARQLSGTAANAVTQCIAAVAGGSRQIFSRPASWLDDHAGMSRAYVVATVQRWGTAIQASSRSAAGAAVQTLQQDWREVSAAAGRILSRIPRSGPELAAALAATSGSLQHTASAAGSLAARKLRTATHQLQRPEPLPPPPPPPATAASRAWARINGSPKHGSSPPAPSAPASPATVAASKAQQAPLRPAAPAKRLAAPAPAAARLAPQRRAAASKNSLQQTREAAPIAAEMAVPASMRSASPLPPAVAPAGGRRNASVMPPNDVAVALAGAAVRSPASHHGVPAARTAPWSQEQGHATAGPAPAVGLGATAAGCLAALAACGLVTVAFWSGWLAGAGACRREQLDSTGGDEDAYGGPDADDFGGHLLDAVDFDAAVAGGHDVNPRRHTIATTQPQGREFTWLRPNEVVTRPTTASGSGGLDYLWLRSRVVVRLSPEARDRVARSSTMRNLGRDTSFRSPMGMLRGVDYAPRGRRGNGPSADTASAAAADEPATAVSARRAARRLTLG